MWFAAYYAFYFALKYDFKLSIAKVDDVIETGDCILKTLEFVYARQNNNKEAMKKLKDDAKALLDNGEESSNWVFVYEALSIQELSGDFSAMKKHGVSFVKSVNEIRNK